MGLVALDPGLQADPLAVRLHRPRAGLECPRFRRSAAGGGGGRDRPPVVEDPRHVEDGAGALGHLQHQVPVLGALESGVEAADLLDQRAPQHAEVAGVHLGPQPLGRPVRLEEGAEVEAGADDLVLVGVDVVRLRVAEQGLVDVRERIGVQLVVVVEQGHELPRRHPQRVVGGGDDAAVALAPPHPDPRVVPLGGGEPVRHVSLAGGVVDQAELPVPEALAPDRLQHPGEDRRRRFVHRRHDREAGSVQGRGLSDGRAGAAA